MCSLLSLRMKEALSFVSRVALCYAQAKLMFNFQPKVEVRILQKQ